MRLLIVKLEVNGLRLPFTVIVCIINQMYSAEENCIFILNHPLKKFKEVIDTQRCKLAITINQW